VLVPAREKNYTVPPPFLYITSLSINGWQSAACPSSLAILYFFYIIFNIKISMRINSMTALSINLPNQLAEASQQAAEALGISRTQFIRQAVIHELANFHAQRERELMARHL
jgi:hypothetical protein